MLEARKRSHGESVDSDDFHAPDAAVPSFSKPAHENDATISLGMANIIGFAILPIASVVIIVPHWLLWGKAAVGVGFMSIMHWWISLPVFLLLIVLHEGLHAFGYLFVGKVSVSDIKFGINWKLLTPYAHCASPMTAHAYRIAVTLPGFLLGVVPVIVGILTGNGILTVWGFIMFVSAGGDAAILWAIRSVPGGKTVKDHPTRAGCSVLGAE